uniref:Uncharacterized protein n=1 Tax=Solanum lycopersicum TaxID=4081 RepID=A0A3Q7IDU3_SOLLC
MQCILRVGGDAPLSCTNKNYASREKYKKCGQPKEVAAIPAIAIPGAYLPSHPKYFARTQGGMEQRLNIGFLGHGDLQQLPLSSNMSLGCFQIQMDGVMVTGSAVVPFTTTILYKKCNVSAPPASSSSLASTPITEPGLAILPQSFVKFLMLLSPAISGLAPQHLSAFISFFVNNLH